MLRSFFIILSIINIIVCGQQYIDSYSSAGKDVYTDDVLLRDLLNAMNNKDSSEPFANYFDIEGNLPKELEMVLRSSYQQTPEDYDYSNIFNRELNPKLRDQEYLQHSSLWGGHQFTPNDLSDINKDLKINNHPSSLSLSSSSSSPLLKMDNSLPAYCNPPNPCPYGYDASHGCLIEFENTALYSREYQAAQDCTCDSEHMFDCGGQQQQDNGRGSGSAVTGRNNDMTSTMDKFLIHQFQNDNDLENSNPINAIVKKLFDLSMAQKNPYLEGDKLPIAAKKGNHIQMYNNN